MPFGPLISKPGSSLNLKTGSWRLGKKPMFAHKGCTACKMCYTVCPEGCISARWVSAVKAEKNTFQPDYDYCKGCGLCSKVCPVKDEITMVEELTPQETK